MDGMFVLAGKTALVTGGSSGIGRGLAEGLARAGAAVAVTGRRKRNLEEVADKIRSAGGSALVLEADLLEPGDRARMVEEALGWREGIDILVNCAGITTRQAAVDFRESDWRRTLEMNLTVPFLLSQAVGKAMIERGGGGSIINVASLLCMAARPTIPAYTASKGGLAQLTKALAVEWAKHNIRVNAIAPGYIRTEMTQPLYEDEQFSRWVVSRTPAGRWGEPADLVGPAAMLASGAGAFVTGQVIYVDGGFVSSL